jgi:hypothetical protein
MGEKKYNIDLYETTKLGRILKVSLGVISLIATGWFIYSVSGTEASAVTAWIAIVFLFLFSLWLIISGLGYTDRYIIVGDKKMTLRATVVMYPVIFTPDNLKQVELKPLEILFHGENGKKSLKLGTYYPDHSVEIIEAVISFCQRNEIDIMGINHGNQMDLP